MPQEKTANIAACKAHLSHFIEYPRVETVEALTLATPTLSKRIINHLDQQCVHPNVLQSMAQKGVEVFEELSPEPVVELSISDSLLPLLGLRRI